MMKKIGPVVLSALLASCASLQYVEHVAPPGLAQAASAKSVTLALDGIRYPNTLLEIYQKIPGTEFYFGKPYNGLSNYVEYHQFTPQPLLKALTPEQVGDLTLSTVAAALQGRASFKTQLATTGFESMTVSDVDAQGQAAPAATYDIKTAVLPSPRNPSAFARQTGTDLTILVSPEFFVATGRGAATQDTKAIMPLRVDEGDHLVIVQASISIEVYDASGKEIYANASPSEKFRYYSRASDAVTLLRDARSAGDLDAFVLSPAFKDLVTKALLRSSAEFVRQLRPIVVGEFVEVKAEKKGS